MVGGKVCHITALLDEQEPVATQLEKNKRAQHVSEEVTVTADSKV